MPIAVRAVIAVGFGMTPVLEERFDDLAFVLVCVGCASVASLAIVWDWQMQRGPFRRDLLSDILSLLVLVPVVEVANSIQIADSRFGGRLPNVLAGLGAALAVYMMVILLMRTIPPRFRTDPSIGVLPGALIIAAGIGGADLFAAAQFWQGMSAAWLLAALATLIYGLGPRALRGIISIATFVFFAVAVFVLAASDSSGPNVNPSASEVSIVAVIAVGLLLLAAMAPPAARRRSRPTPPAEWGERR